jgi:TRAP-type C4-dicarboxylate transport system permease small subunit
MAWFYSVGIVFSLSAALLVAVDLWRLATGRLRDDELVQVRDEEAA